MQDLPSIEALLQLLEQQSQTIEQQSNKTTSLEAELAEAYKQIMTLSNSDKELQAAQQLKRNADAELESSKRKLNAAELRLNEARQQKETLQKLEEKLSEREKQLAATITAAKEQAAKNARAKLDAERRQLVKDKKALATAQQDAEKAKQQAYDDAYNDYILLIKVLTIFCFAAGAITTIKHIAVISVYWDWCMWLAARYGVIAGAAIVVAGAAVPVWGYTAPSHPLWMAYRLIAVIGLLMLADYVAPTTAAIIIYAAGWLIAGARLYINHLIDKSCSL